MYGFSRLLTLLLLGCGELHRHEERRSVVPRHQQSGSMGVFIVLDGIGAVKDAGIRGAVVRVYERRCYTAADGGLHKFLRYLEPLAVEEVQHV